jgi:hypothetical protein
MVDQRLIHREIFQSTLFYDLGEKFPGKELNAQRVFETLIVLADDYGRGRYIQADIRARAFTSAPSAFGETTLDDIDKFMDVIEKNKSAFRYPIEGDTYFFMPKWFEYQPLKYRKKSHIVPPSKKFLSKLKLYLADSGEILPMEEKRGGKLDKTPTEEKGKEKKKKEKKENVDKPPNKFLIISDRYYKLYDERFGGKPGWGSGQQQRVSELFDKYPHDTPEQLADVLDYMFSHEDDLWTPHLSNFMSITQEFFERARAMRGGKNVNLKGWRCGECNYFGEGKFPGRCTHCGSNVYDSGKLPDGWEAKNAQIETKKT